jgi:carboxypeptidase Taq
MYATAVNVDKGIPAAISDGNFKPLLSWLRANIHGQGRLMNADDLIRKVSGAPLDTRFFKEHVQARYLND